MWFPGLVTALNVSSLDLLLVLSEFVAARPPSASGGVDEVWRGYIPSFCRHPLLLALSPPFIGLCDDGSMDQLPDISGLTDAARAASRVLANATSRESEERRVGKECRSRWSPYH